ncbi:MAG: DUF4440 domain-containing protein [Burkholderiales bacterium]|nr:DUF4440 domain-containing protein [Burkholderiales bacterium]
MIRIGLLCLGLAAVHVAAGDVESYKAELIAADTAFAAQSHSEGEKAAFLAWVGEDATMFRSSGPPVVGKAEITRYVQSWPPGELGWHPLKADAAASGDLGYTWGEYTATGKGKDGKPYELHGHYVSVWKRDAAGHWKWVVDIGSDG